MLAAHVLDATQEIIKHNSAHLQANHVIFVKKLVTPSQFADFCEIASREERRTSFSTLQKKAHSTVYWTSNEKYAAPHYLIIDDDPACYLAQAESPQLPSRTGRTSLEMLVVFKFHKFNFI